MRRRITFGRRNGEFGLGEGSGGKLGTFVYLLHPGEANVNPAAGAVRTQAPRRGRRIDSERSPERRQQQRGDHAAPGKLSKV